MLGSQGSPHRTTLLPLQPLSPDLIPPELVVPPDQLSKIYRVVRLSRRVDVGERLRVDFGGSSQVGVVLEQHELGDRDVGALCAIYRDPDLAEMPDPDDEVFLRLDNSQSTRPQSSAGRDIFDFTAETNASPPLRAMRNIFDFTDNEENDS